jgi:hypothetical protein
MHTRVGGGGGGGGYKVIISCFPSVRRQNDIRAFNIVCIFGAVSVCVAANVHSSKHSAHDTLQNQNNIYYLYHSTSDIVRRFRWKKK